MTILVGRRQRKQTRAEQTISAARDIGRKKLDRMSRFLDEKEKLEYRRKSAAIRRYAKKHGLLLEFHRKPWIFRPFGGMGVKVAMPAG